MRSNGTMTQVRLGSWLIAPEWMITQMSPGALVVPPRPINIQAFRSVAWAVY